VAQAFTETGLKHFLKKVWIKQRPEKQAFEDFSKTADEAQQSSDPYLVSQEQRSVLGRLVLAFPKHSDAVHPLNEKSDEGSC
jgi:hypothetical protein